VLLFLVLFFVYPLKFVFSHVIPSLLGMQHTPLTMTESDGRMMLWVYSAGFMAMMSVFALLYWNQYRRRVQLALSPEQVFEATAGVRSHLLSVGVAVLSIVLALTIPIGLIWIAGAIYSLQGPVHAMNGSFTARQRARRFPSSTPARP
jgi:hypothetical protein